MRTIEKYLERKRRLALDAWGRYPSDEVEAVINPLVEYIDRNLATSKDQYPTPWFTERQITRLINNIWMSSCSSDEFAELFRGMSLEELEECAQSFAFENCLQRDGLNKALEAHADASSTVDEGWTRPSMSWVDESKLESD